ncbi:condensation domain-containing protein [Streptomyces sp. NPDC048312]|uniref:condensation domain-containing protein n=1 Tax=Streptomyces sp. NPDC048312 TaxID=3155485 RepID=UPI0033D15595
MSSSSYVGALGAGHGHDFSDFYIFPASSAQSRLWFLCELEPESNAAYNVISAVRLLGTLDRLRLQQAVDVVVARHESLRTGVALVDGTPQQVVLPSALVALPTVDHTAADEETRRRAVTDIVREEASRPFTLHRPPLVRMVLLRLADDEHVLVVTMHHTVCDGWSTELFFRDLATSYAGLMAGGSGELKELPIQYADYVAWQNEQLSGDRLDTLLAHWRERLAGVPLLDLPTDLPRPPVRTLRGAQCTADLSADLTGRLGRVAQDRGATIFMLLLTAFKALLAAGSGQCDIAVGTPVAGREHPEAEELIGFFANTLVLRSRIAPDETFTEALDTVRATCLDAFSHQDVPFDRLVEELRPPRDLSRTPLFQAMFSLQNTPGITLDLPGLRLEPVETEHASAKFDLWLTCLPTGDGLRLQLEYNTDLFDAATADRLLRHYCGLLDHVADDPVRPLNRLLRGGDAAGAPAPQPLPDRTATTVATLLDAHVEHDPSAIAVVEPDSILTRRQLRTLAHRLAHRLRAAGAAPGTVVAVSVPRGTLDAVVAVYAVLASGAALAYVSPDDDRHVAWVLADAAPVVLLTTGTRGAQGGPDAQGAHMVPLPMTVTMGGDATGQEPDAPPLSVPRPGDTACVVYAFGRSARPTGVRIGHRAFAASLVEAARRTDLTSDDTVAVVADEDAHEDGLTPWRLLLPLTAGVRAVFPSADDKDDKDDKGDTGVTDVTDATVLVASTGTWRRLADEGALDTGSRVVAIGEPLPATAAARPGLWRLHGSAEALASGAAYEDRGPLSGLGRAAGHLRRYILDPDLCPVPDGMVGDLYVSGPGLADGYHARPADTARRFLPDPYAPEPGARMHRTGDLCQYGSDGEVRFVGRAGGELRIRDRWIDPAEPEALLREHPLVRRAAVVAGEFGDDIRLVGWLEPDRSAAPPDEPVTDGELLRLLRQSLSEQLPAHLVPSVFGVLDALPLASDGTVDRQALRARKDEATFGLTDSTPPRDAIERRMVSLFLEVLPYPEIGVHANFFALGGHSLLAAKLLGRVRTEFGTAVPVREFFKRSTPAGLAEALRGAQETRRTGRGTAAADGAALNGMSDEEVTRLLQRHLR